MQDLINHNSEYNKEQLDLCKKITDDLQIEKKAHLFNQLKQIMSLEQYNLFRHDLITKQLNNINKEFQQISQTPMPDHGTIATMDFWMRVLKEQKTNIQIQQQSLIDQLM